MKALLLALILSLFFAIPAMAATYQCDKSAGQWCEEKGCKAYSGEVTKGCTAILTASYWTKTDEEPYPNSCQDYGVIGMSSATSESWSGTDLVNCDRVWLANEHTTPLLIYFGSLSNPWPLLLPGTPSGALPRIYERAVNYEFETIYIEATDATGGNCTVWSFR